VRASRLVLFVTALVTVPALRAAQPHGTIAFLHDVLGFSGGEIRQIAQGRPAIHSFATSDDREVAIAGAVRVAISPEQYIDQLRDIVAFKRHEVVRQIGTFSPNPTVGDVSGLTLDREHLDDLEGCRLHDCGFHLSGAGIARMRSVEWSSPQSHEQANRIIRELLTEVASGYLRQGDGALMVYENQRQAVSVGEEFRAMTAAPPAILERFPMLAQHVTHYPSRRIDGVEDVLYWSKEDVGPKVVISITHMAIARVASGPVVFAAASKQLYGSHYFDTSLGLTLLLTDDQPTSTVLVYLNRSRIDALDGFLGGVKRAIVRSRARSAMSETLARVRTRLPQRVRR
jgi:hypothetical protein